MSNAAKHRKKAAEFEQLKQIDRAIASYVKAIEESEAAGEEIDVALFNKVGDLALRQGRVPDAITYYERAVEHYATSGLFNNAIALCNKILRNAPGRANVYFTLGRICAKKGLRGDATRNFLEYATRMQQEGRVDEGMRALAEVADLMPELTEVQALVEEHAARAGIVLPRRRTPIRAAEAVPAPADAQGQRPVREERKSDLIFLDVDYGDPRSRTPVGTRRVPTPRHAPSVPTPGAGEKALSPSAGLQALPFLDVSERVEGLVDAPGELGGAADVADVIDVAPEPSVVRPPEISTVPVEAVDGLEALPGALGADAELLEGFSSDSEVDDGTVVEPVAPPTDVTWLVPPDVGDSVAPLDDVLIEDITDPLGESAVQSVILSETPLAVPAVPEPDVSSETVEVEPMELDFLDIEPLDAPAFELEAFDLPMIDHLDEAASLDDSLGIEGLDASSFDFEVQQAEESGELGYVEPLDVTAVPELDAAIAAGEELVAQAEAAEAEAEAEVAQAYADVGTEIAAPTHVPASTPEPVLPRASYRIDPHDFVQSGELPPLLLADALVDRGLRVALATPAVGVVSIAAPAEPVVEQAPVEMASAHDDVIEDIAAEAELLDLDAPESGNEAASSLLDVELATVDANTSLAVTAEVPAPDAPILAEPDALLDLDAVEIGGGPEVLPPAVPSSDEAPVAPHDAMALDLTAASASEVEPQPDSVTALTVAEDAQPSVTPHDATDADDVTDDLADTPPHSGVAYATPSLPTAAVAAEAVVVATSRRDALRAAVARLPQNWLLRRRLAESLFEAGERDAALHELETAQQGLLNEGEYQSAAEIADELVQVAPDRVPYHQKRVELAVRLQNQDRLQLTYLDLADALVRMGEEGRARAVYARVLELDPYDERARAALGAAAPPPPPPPRPDDQFVDLADWLRDDDQPASTRMRMREPAISGDEQADFNALLQHFKDGVSRSLGENDFEGHYDLGVAYKEMGLLDDAIAEFQKALRSRAHRLPAYEALGQCFVEQGRHQIAATVLSRALHEPGLDDDQRVGVLYLLAHSCEALQRRDEARSYFQRVYATDINFRDVAARLAALDHATR